ncbi:hypothetical protein [Butyricicoccus pullicaecorum]|uniref:hypothetical protein n=1 Tax=Butyricicoccus pullicaecorum TaxID=501571 RepID=UPI0039909080
MNDLNRNTDSLNDVLFATPIFLLVLCGLKSLTYQIDISPIIFLIPIILWLMGCLILLCKYFCVVKKSAEIKENELNKKEKVQAIKLIAFLFFMVIWCEIFAFVI